MASETSNQGECPCEITPISRGERNETKIDLRNIEDEKLFDENGKEYKFKELYEDRKCIIIFVRVSI